MAPINHIRDYEYELGRPWEHLDAWQKVSYPFLHADRIKTPTLFLCGEKDFNVPLLNTEQMYQALRSLGIPTQLVIYPEQFHQLGSQVISSTVIVVTLPGSTNICRPRIDRGTLAARPRPPEELAEGEFMRAQERVSSAHSNKQREKRCDKNQAIDSIEHAPVSGNRRAPILCSEVALDQAEGEIADLPAEANNQTGAKQLARAEVGNEKRTSQGRIIEKTSAPKEPSQVLRGLIALRSGCRPKIFPKVKAATSFTSVARMRKHK